MDTKQTLDIVDEYFNILEASGYMDNKNLKALLYLMFIDEYYEYYRDVSLKDMDNDEIGLTDCLVKTLNAKLDCLKDLIDLIRCFNLDYLPTKNHWIIVNPDDPGEYYYVEDYILHTTNDVIEDNVLISSKLIIDEILQP